MDSFTNPSLEKDIAFDLATQPALLKTNCGAENVHTTREQKKAIPCTRKNVPPLMTLIVHGSSHLCTYPSVQSYLKYAILVWSNVIGLVI
ncbi:18864_t:CDS:2 [Acaulospora morrowiae]|uniref:18864_t:CDS:1 n=1 Tax=Acaulospora morrowiae TaxID=94023 RepID=A0A9N9F0D6_9GLOM|nr:18864_t:CDS:2 [Acaulospora morrowiae]